jgi:L-aspartate oxidase
VGLVLTHVALKREETRGGHVRNDFPERDDERFLGHIHAVRRLVGTVETSFDPITGPQANG